MTHSLVDLPQFLIEFFHDHARMERMFFFCDRDKVN